TRHGQVLALSLDARQAPAALIAELAGVGPDRLRVSGSAKLTAKLEATAPGRPAAESLRGDVALSADGAIVNDVALSRVSAHAHVEPGVVRIGEASFDLFGGTVSGSGTLAGSGGSLDIAAKGVDLAAIAAAHGGPSLAGHLDAKGRLDL